MRDLAPEPSGQEAAFPKHQPADFLPPLHVTAGPEKRPLTAFLYPPGEESQNSSPWATAASHLQIPKKPYPFGVNQ